MSSFLAIDFETANNASDSACAIGLVRAENGKIIREEAFLIRPPSPDFFFTHIHGLTWEHVADAPDFGDLWPDMAPLFDGVDFFAAHNAGFDSRVLRSCCDRYGLDIPTKDFTCTVKLARGMWEVRPTKLPNVAHFLGLELTHHDALSDSRACANIVLAAERDGWSFETGYDNVRERYIAIDQL
ncbi:exonuclease [Sneathiella chungangensis]|uniref:Exonuclease n=1 Tax=Sneathiella chungangensis TaxID=1418234 RepID=A0A845MJV1_9PROT|nr:3'-5' exonuclease [Sneathiella chungangensis]MZR23576.1 exonuclease [Sneathiella chungangensis]